MKKMKTLVIKKSWWYRGKVKGSALLGKDGTMCCLGFLGVACGIEENMTDKGFPSSCDEQDKFPLGLIGNENELGDDLETQIAWVNDDLQLNDAQRMQKLRPLFAKINYRLRFTK